MKQKWTGFCPRLLKIMRAIGVFTLVLFMAIITIASFFPEVAAQNVDRLRNIVGDAPVAQLESFVLSIQDHVHQLEYDLGLLKVSAPWTPSLSDTTSIAVIDATRSTDTQVVGALPAVTVSSSSDGSIQTTVSTYNSPTPPILPAIPSATVVAPISTKPLQPGLSTGLPDSPTPVTLSSLSTPSLSISSTARPMITAVVTNSPIPIKTPVWHLPPLTPFSKLPGEGQWSPYLQMVKDRPPIAYRTFLQPDPERPYAIPAIVAINLQATRLHYVLGTMDPSPTTPQPSRTGVIPTADMQPGVLLAAFNGGFKARHGHYGAMADNLVALPAIEGLATVAIYATGQVKIGEWGIDIKDSSSLVAWRQNGKMLIRNGQINPATALTTISWGLTVESLAITWRSALGLSADGNTLYYVAGPHLDVSTLAKVMAQVGAANALQLDINNTWVHFTAIHSTGATLVAEPLLTEMLYNTDRYLKTSTDDFFYLTLASPS